MSQPSWQSWQDKDEWPSGPGRDAPADVPGLYGLAGHTHPCVNLQGRGREHLRLPCFWFRPTHAVLPAFGAFTGMADVEPDEADRVYVVAGDRVLAVK